MSVVPGAWAAEGRIVAPGIPEPRAPPGAWDPAALTVTESINFLPVWDNVSSGVAVFYPATDRTLVGSPVLDAPSPTVRPWFLPSPPSTSLLPLEVDWQP